MTKRKLLPPKPYVEPKSVLSVYLPTRVIDRLDCLAVNCGQGRSATAAQLLLNAIIDAERGIAQAGH